MANEDIPSGVDALVILVEDPNAKREGFKVRSEPASSSSPLFCLLENRAINLGGKGHWNLKFWRDERKRAITVTSSVALICESLYIGRNGQPKSGFVSTTTIWHIDGV
jgi:hypothetical protein